MISFAKTYKGRGIGQIHDHLLLAGTRLRQEDGSGEAVYQETLRYIEILYILFEIYWVRKN